MSRHIQKEWRGRQAGLRVRETERRSEDCSFSLRDGEGGEREREKERRTRRLAFMSSLCGNRDGDPCSVPFPLFMA